MRPTQRRSNFRIRVLVFAALAIAIVGAGAYAVWPRALATSDTGLADLTMRVDMGGFTPPQLSAPAGRALRIRLVNPDSSMHSDGNGVHQLAIPGLGIDVKVQPQSSSVVQIPASPAGEYAFYCDTCCGGKENPSMQGKLRLGA